jgi:hypothetical protein
MFFAGCARYAITDLESGKNFYTEDIDDIGDGAIRFEDAKTGKEVTLQSSEVKKIDKEDYNIAVHGTANP